jgi:serine/threonine-protein kinase
MLALLLSVLCFVGYGVRTAIVAARNDARARRQTVLAQRMGQAVKDLEWRMRSVYLVPLHDTEAEKAEVRARMATLRDELQEAGEGGAGLQHYALGRGHLTLHEFDAAYQELMQAQALGVREPELDYALGRVLGEKYRRALDAARRSGDASFFQARKQDLEQTYLVPARLYLSRSRGQQAIPTSYLEGLIDFYHERYDAALLHADFAARGATWLYEAPQLAGDVYLAQALSARDAGDEKQAEKAFVRAVAAYERAAEIGRSDPMIYEALAEVWVRREEGEVLVGRDPSTSLAHALAAAEQANAAAKTESAGYTKKAFAYYFAAQFAQQHGGSDAEVQRLYRAQAASGAQALVYQPTDAFAHEVTGMAYLRLAEQLGEKATAIGNELAQSRNHLKEAIRLNPTFPWAYNDYGLALGVAAEDAKRQGHDARALLREAIEMTEKASVLDARYVIAFTKTSLLAQELAASEQLHGESPMGNLDKAIAWAERALQINAQHPLAHGNASAALLAKSAHLLSLRQDGREPAWAAVAHLQAIGRMDPTMPLVHAELARAYLLLAQHEARLGNDAAALLDRAGQQVASCLRLVGGAKDCAALQQLLRAEKRKAENKIAQPLPKRLTARVSGEEARRYRDS